MKDSIKIGKKPYRLPSNRNGCIETRSLAGYEAIKLASANAAMEVLPGYGGRLNGLWLTDHARRKNILDGYQRRLDLLNDDSFHNAWLFPFANRLNGGQYQHNGQNFQFPLNEPQKKNALHGFLYNKSMQIEEIGYEANSAFIKLSYHYAGAFDYYPFNFKLAITYHLRASNTFEIQIEIKNTGAQTAPLSFGWHPYFTFDHEIKDLCIQIPSAKRVEVDKQLLPTGNLIDDDRFFQGGMLQDDQLDDNFKLISGEDRAISITSVPDQLRLRLTVDQAINYMQVYTPPDRRSIALEPVTSNIDAFNNGESLLTVDPGQSFKTTFNITLSKII